MLASSFVPDYEIALRLMKRYANSWRRVNEDVVIPGCEKVSTHAGLRADCTAIMRRRGARS
jgi:hypothetical protein